MFNLWRQRRLGLCAGIALAIAGCSMHPLPGDFSRKSTFQIIEKIRCEGAEPLRAIPRGHPFLKTVFIGYDFDFNITEANSAGNPEDQNLLTFSGTRPSGRSVSLDLRGGVDATRAAQRTFRIIESLEQLQTADCSPERTRGNWLYPITGSIGMDEIVHTYVGLERITTVGTPLEQNGTTPVGPVAGGSSTAPVVFSDVLTFTTTLGASAKPTLTLNAVGVGSFKLTGASFFGSATRTDAHKLTVVIARDPAGAEPPALRSGAGNARASNTESKESVYRDAIRSYQTNPTNNLSNNLVANGVLGGPYSTRYIRTLDALEQKRLPADSRVYVELERLRAKEDEDKFIERLVELIKPGP